MQDEEEGPDWRALNLAMWDAKVPAHLGSPVYDLAGFRAGRLSLRPHEVADLGDVAGKALAHLQCHIGLDTLSWARLGARVSGLDFSPASVDAAQALAAECGLDAQFACADVYDACQALGSQRYDIVYTGVGALCWLPDLARWAAVVRALLQPGGQLYLFEFHPVEWMLGIDAAGALALRYDYFTPVEGYRDAGAVSYADAAPGVAARTVQWNHGLGEVVTALVSVGLRIDSLRELDASVLDAFPGMVRAPDGLFRMGPRRPSLPLMYVLRATRP